MVRLGQQYGGVLHHVRLFEDFPRRVIAPPPADATGHRPLLLLLLVSRVDYPPRHSAGDPSHAARHRPHNARRRDGGTTHPPSPLRSSGHDLQHQRALCPLLPLVYHGVVEVAMEALEGASATSAREGGEEEEEVDGGTLRVGLEEVVQSYFAAVTTAAMAGRGGPRRRRAGFLRPRPRRQRRGVEIDVDACVAHDPLDLRRRREPVARRRPSEVDDLVAAIRVVVAVLPAPVPGRAVAVPSPPSPSSSPRE